jgi:hypothetical protein
MTLKDMLTGHQRDPQEAPQTPMAEKSPAPPEERGALRACTSEGTHGTRIARIAGSGIDYSSTNTNACVRLTSTYLTSLSNSLKSQRVGGLE